jgi:hypothetical protein
MSGGPTSGPGSQTGGVFPGQAGKANFDWAENEVKSAATFPGMSTMATMSSAGDYMGWAEELQKMSQNDITAQNAVNSANKQATTSQLSSLGSIIGGFLP